MINTLNTYAKIHYIGITTNYIQKSEILGSH